MDTKFSILMAFYSGDSPSLLRAALQSILDNSVKPSEVYLIQDGNVSRELSDTVTDFIGLLPINLHVNDKNIGLRESLNNGLLNVANDIVIRADADDVNNQNRFERLLEVLERGYDLVGSHIQEVDQDGAPIAFRKVPLDMAEIAAGISMRNPFNHMSVAFRRQAVIGCGGYPDLHLREDYGLWARMLASGCKMKNLDEILVKATTGKLMYRRRGGYRYALAEISMQRFLVALGLQPVVKGVAVGFLRAAVFMLPAAIRGRVYERWLRSDSLY